MVEHNTAIDYIKGFLIILVILGHLIKGSLDESLTRFVIYAFHMPAFFFVSGYLLNTFKIAKFTPKELFEKYKNRMLLSWLVALIVYSLINSFLGEGDLLSIVKSVILPYYHLWFVPTFFSFIVIIYAVLRFVKTDYYRNLWFLLISLLLYIPDVYFHILLPLDIRTGFFVFMILGVMTARRKNCEIKWKSIITIIEFFVLFGVFYFINEPRSFFMKYLNFPFNICLCLLVVLPIIHKASLTNDTLEFLGVNSLSIYLWHVLPIMALKKYIHNDFLYYGMALIMMTISYLIIRNRAWLVKIVTR